MSLVLYSMIPVTHSMGAMRAILRLAYWEHRRSRTMACDAKTTPRSREDSENAAEVHWQLRSVGSPKRVESSSHAASSLASAERVR
jgi:hypothetical protein